jgi:hypothetical protein
MLLILFAFSSNSLALELQANVIYGYDLNANSLVVEEIGVRYQKYAYDGDVTTGTAITNTCKSYTNLRT